MRQVYYSEFVVSDCLNVDELYYPATTFSYFFKDDKKREQLLKAGLNEISFQEEVLRFVQKEGSVFVAKRKDIVANLAKNQVNLQNYQYTAVLQKQMTLEEIQRKSEEAVRLLKEVQLTYPQFTQGNERVCRLLDVHGRDLLSNAIRLDTFIQQLKNSAKNE
jgi:hypothetical protein